MVNQPQKFVVDPTRARQINDAQFKPAGPILFWMARDMRFYDNWALLYAQELALKHNVPLLAVFIMPTTFLGAGIRQYEFAIKGMEETQKYFEKANIPFAVIPGMPGDGVIECVKNFNVSAVVTDFNPLHINMQTKQYISEALPETPFFEVDTHNVVPCWEASPKLEFAAYTFRPKIRRLLSHYLTDIPKMKKHRIPYTGNFPKTDFNAIRKTLKVDMSVREVDWVKPGESAARRALQVFIETRLRKYKELRSDPTNVEAQSDLSPYLHFGHIAPQRVAFEVSLLPESESREAFLEELVVRRELTDNFCYYNPNYDTFAGFPEWAKKSLNEHRHDPREHLYTLQELETAQTYDDLWNAAQLEMVLRGKMHNYMRMYWAKKILEWTPDPETALEYAIHLNDKYEIDGRDPNGYVGCAWSIGGVHDRAWFERPIFGKIRYMNYNGAKSKFKVKEYIAWVNGLKI